MAIGLKAVGLLILRRIQLAKLCFIYEEILISKVAELKNSKIRTRNEQEKCIRHRLNDTLSHENVFMAERKRQAA